jgi:hypothetical protein
MSDRQKLFYALLASAFFHLALGLVLALWTAQHTDDVARALPDLRDLTVTIMPQRASPPSPAAPAPPAPTPAPGHLLTTAPAATPPVMDSDGLTHSNKAPAKAAFQSDANMVAGSQLPATGNLPLPSMAGPRRHFMDFANQAASMGNGFTPPLPASAGQNAPMPEQTPSAITQVQHSARAQAQATPAPIPKPTPRPAPTAAPDTLALGTPTPTPAPPAPTPAAVLAKLMLPPPMRGHADMAPMTPMTRSPDTQPAPPPQRPPQPATQRETEQTRIEGGITNPGGPGVDAIETPFGRYHHKLYNLIGSRWKLYLQEHPTDVGDVTILVTLKPNGKVAATRVTANNALDDLADISTKAIMDSELPPVPDDLAPMLRDGKLEVSFSFSVYDPSHDSPGR